MASGKRRIQLDPAPTSLGFWARLFRRPQAVAVTPVAEQPAGEEGPSRVDFRLQRRASIRAVRAFIESIDTYQLHTRRTVHVVSRYRLPGDPGLQEKVPEWLAERVRFGVVKGHQDFGYLHIRAVDVIWDDDGSELYLHLDEKVAPGTRAFIAAYLGEGDGAEEMRDLPATLLLGEP